MLSFSPLSDSPISAQADFMQGNSVPIVVAIENTATQSVAIDVLRQTVLDIFESSLVATGFDVERDLSLETVLSTAACDIAVDASRSLGVSVGSVVSISISFRRDIDQSVDIDSMMSVAPSISVQRSIESSADNMSDVQINLGGIRCFGSSIENTITVSMPDIIFNRVFCAAIGSESNFESNISIDRGIGFTVGAMSDVVASLLSGGDYDFERVYISSPTVSALLLVSAIDTTQDITAKTEEIIELVSAINTAVNIISVPARRVEL